VRYADDCNIYVRSEQAGQRVMESVKRFISKRLKLKVNEQKSAVARPTGAEVSRLQFQRRSGDSADDCAPRRSNALRIGFEISRVRVGA